MTFSASKPSEILDFQFVNDHFYITWLYPNISNGPIKHFNIMTKSLHKRETFFIQASDHVATYYTTVNNKILLHFNYDYKNLLDSFKLYPFQR